MEAVAVFNAATLTELREGLEESELRAAAGDLDAARKVAHRLKGMASNFGAARLAAIARRIELEAPAIDIVSKHVRPLEIALHETQAKISAIA
jgi:histidine phosphotransfer protein HptB